MEALTAKEAKTSLRLMGAKYRVKIFEAPYASGIEDLMNRWLDGVGSKVDIIEFFPVSVSTAIGLGMVAKPQIQIPLQVEITTPDRHGSGSPIQCPNCYSNVNTLSVDENTDKQEETIAAVGVFYIEYPDEKQSE